MFLLSVSSVPLWFVLLSQPRRGRVIPWRHNGLGRGGFQQHGLGTFRLDPLIEFASVQRPGFLDLILQVDDRLNELIIAMRNVGNRKWNTLSEDDAASIRLTAACWSGV